MHEWIIPRLVKSQLLIPAEIWDNTPSMTNTNEAQHAWTNSLTSISRPPLEALETAYEVDKTVAQEIEMSLRAGILSNPNNEISNRMSHNATRQSTSVSQAHESRQLTDTSTQIKLQLEEEAEKRRKSNAATKLLKEQLKANKAASGKKLQRAREVCGDPVRRHSAAYTFEVRQCIRDGQIPRCSGARPFGAAWQCACGVEA
ncbi:hypothetical protein C8R44DRAFT_982020 [Mycena epipterygia]|nr:hypothetical protein C8R44DRAFT_982020 [Mycena epipterygia]